MIFYPGKKEVSVAEMASDGVLNLCSVKGFRIPKELCVVLGLLLGKGLEFAFIVFTHDIENTNENVVTQAI